MKKILFAITALLGTHISAQVAVGTTTISSPSVSLEFGAFEPLNPSDLTVKGNGKGLILPWVSTVANTPNATYKGITVPVEGSMIYDITDHKVKIYENASWRDLTKSTNGSANTALQDARDEKANAITRIGTLEESSNGILVLSDKDKAMVLPKMPSPHLNIINPEPGTIAYDTLKNQLCIFNGTTWSFWEGVNPTVSTFAGSGFVGTTNSTLLASRFQNPSGIAIDGSGNMYIADYGNHLIRKISSTGTLSTFAGSSYGFTNGTGTAASFKNPYSIAVDTNGNLYVADTTNNCIRKITPSGVVSTYAGTGTAGFTNGNAASATFNDPFGVAVDSSGNVYVADTQNNCIRKIDGSGNVTTLAGGSGIGNVDGTGTSAKFNSPIGVSADVSGNVYVADFGNHKIRKITPAGVVTTVAGNGTAGSTDGVGTAASFNNPTGIAIDNAGDLYIADKGGNKIRKITINGYSVSTIAGSSSTSGSSDGSAYYATFNGPAALYFDANQNLFIADFGNNKIRKIVLE